MLLNPRPYSDDMLIIRLDTFFLQKNLDNLPQKKRKIQKTSLIVKFQNYTDRYICVTVRFMVGKS